MDTKAKVTCAQYLGKTGLLLMWTSEQVRPETCTPHHLQTPHNTCHFRPSFLSQRFSLSFLPLQWLVIWDILSTPILFCPVLLPFPLSLCGVCVCVCVCARARAHPRACVRTHVWVGGVLQHIISNSSLYKSILLPYLLLNTCRTEWCMHCTHVFIWCCERAGFVW